jgi:hypothetical protein
MSLLTVGTPKLLKGQKKGYLSSVLHFAPADLSGKEVCPKRTAGCTMACLNTAGRGGIFKKGESTNVIQQARIRKTKAFFENRQAFLNELTVEIIKTKTKAEKQGLIPVFRLNGTSDLAWEKYEVANGKNIFQMFPEVQFYDYTKNNSRSIAPNHHLTYSSDGVAQVVEGKTIGIGSNWKKMMAKLDGGFNVAMAFTSRNDIPAFLKDEVTGKTYQVWNGDNYDARFLPHHLNLFLRDKN